MLVVLLAAGLTAAGSALAAGGAKPPPTPRFLTGPNPGGPVEIALRCASSHARAATTERGARISLQAATSRGGPAPLRVVMSAAKVDEGEDLILKKHYRSAGSGTTHVFLRQRLGGIEVFHSDVAVHVAADGSVIDLCSRMVPEPQNHLAASAKPVLSPLAAVAAAAAALDLPWRGAPAVKGEAAGPMRETVLGGGGISRDDIPAKLNYFKKEGGMLVLAWYIVLHPHASGQWFDLQIDAVTGELLWQFNRYRNAPDTYRVYALPTTNPDDGPRTLVAGPADSEASPYGWHDVNGLPGPDYYVTRGNNVSAQGDLDGDDVGGIQPNGGPTLHFDFPAGLNQSPYSYTEAATVNLFYWNNICHDIHYRYGFDEASGNFQDNNYGRGGAGGDPVEADAQDGWAYNNANFATPPDGQSGRMQMFVWTMTDPWRDGDFDNVIIVHEYGHGVSTRLVGGPHHVTGLRGAQSGGMGEGWSDWWGLVLTAKPGDQGDDERGVGMYVLGQDLDGGGIRHFQYTTNMVANPLTYADLPQTGGQVHYVGEIWCSILWDMYWFLIERYGFDPDLYNGAGGNNVAMQLVMDALKLTPIDPTFVDARDALLLADENRYGGAHQSHIWRACARRGLGVGADPGSSHNSINVTASFEMPPGAGIRLDRYAYRSDADMTVSVEDFFNLDEPSVNVQLYCYQNFTTMSSPGILKSSVALTVLATDIPGRYQSTVTLPALAWLPALPPVDGDMLVLSYAMGAGGLSMTNAPVDDTPPVISAIVGTDMTESSAAITWLTDEPTDGFVKYAPDTDPLPLSGAWEGSSELVGLDVWSFSDVNDRTDVHHRVEIDGLDPTTRYLFAVRSTDAAGNTATVPVDMNSTDPNDYARFATLFERLVFQDDLEEGKGRWTSGGLNDGWHYGPPGGGPPTASSGDNLWQVQLGANYDTMRHCWLETEPIYVGRRPTLRFQNWLRFKDPWYWPTNFVDDVKHAKAFVDVDYGEGWESATPWPTNEATVYRRDVAPYWDSHGWEEQTIRLTNSTHQVIRLRFRLEAREIFRSRCLYWHPFHPPGVHLPIPELNVAPGWYIDDISLTELADPGVWATEVVTPLDDNPAYAPGVNDGDGYPDVGERVKMRFRIFNTDVAAHTGLEGDVDTPSEHIELIGSNVLHYADLDVGAFGVSLGPLEVQITDDPAVEGLRVPFFHTTHATGGGPWPSTVLLQVDVFENVSGVVTNIDGDGVVGARVTASASGQASRTTLTGAAGAYVLAGLVAGVDYRLYASKPGEYVDSEDVIAQSPAAGVGLCLRRVFAEVMPENVHVAIKRGGSTNVTFTIANTNAAAAADLPLAFRMAADPATMGGVSLTFSSGASEVTVPPEGMTNLILTIDADPTVAVGSYNSLVSVVGVYVGDTKAVPVLIDVSTLSVSGTVFNIDGGPVTDAVVRATSPLYGSLTGIAGTDGWYYIAGFLEGVTYQMTASKEGEFTESDPVDVIAPDEVHFVLGRAYATATPGMVVITTGCWQVESGEFTVQNENPNPPPNADTNLQFSLVNEIWLPFATVDLSDGETNTIVLPPADTSNITVTVTTRAPEYGAHTGSVQVVGNQVNGAQRVPVVIVITNWAPDPYFVRVEPHDLGDGDGYFEPGETIRLNFFVANHGTLQGVGASGTVGLLSGPASVDQPAATFPTIYEYNYPSAVGEYSTLDPEISVNPGAPEHSTLSLQIVLATPEVPWVAWTNEFELTVRYSPDIVVAPPSFNMYVLEGHSTNGTLSVSNASLKALDIDLAVEPVQGAASLAGVRSMPAPRIVDWRSLTAEHASMEEVLVKLTPGTTAKAATELARRMGGVLEHRYRLIDYCVIRVPPAMSLAEAAGELAAEPEVIAVEPNYRIQISKTPNDPSFGALWGLHNVGQSNGTINADIDAPEAWDIETGNSNIIVAVVDTGVDYYHEDLSANMWRNPGELGYDAGGLDKRSNDIDDDGNGYVDDVYGANFIWGTGDPWDDSGHGSHCAGTIAAVGSNGVGVAGVCWRARIMALKFLSSLGSGSTADAVEAVEYAITHGARIVNNSWGSQTGPSGAIDDVFEVARQANMIMVCAAGNDGMEATLHYPSAAPHDNVISVAATDRDGLMADFSNYGAASVDLAAPGVDIYSTYPVGRFPGGTYLDLSGTSMATPHVTGIAALLASMSPSAPYSMIVESIFGGVVHDESLEGLMAYEGHANARGAIEAFQRFWLVLATNRLSLAVGEADTVEVFFNPDKRTRAGLYEANIAVIPTDGGTNRVPVTLTVNAAPDMELAGVRVDDSVTGDGDAHAEPGETVDLVIALHNKGSQWMQPATGTIVTIPPGVLLDDGACAWSAGVGALATIESDDPARVTFGGAVSGSVGFAVLVDEGNVGPWQLDFSVMVEAAYSITGKVLSAVDGSAVTGAVIEYFGSAAGSVLSNSNGAYRIDGLPLGNHVLQARRPDFEKSQWTDVLLGVTDATQDFDLGRPAGDVDPSSVSVTVVVAQSADAVVTYTNAGATAWSGDLYEIGDVRAAVISDGEQLNGVEDIVRSLGIPCDMYPHNEAEAYSSDPSVLFGYDIVILDPTGEKATGRKVGIEEFSALEDFVQHGGRLLVTGGNVLSSPDNQNLASVVGSSSVGMQDDPASVGIATAPGDNVLSGPFVTVAGGQEVAVESLRYDNAQASAGLDSEMILQAGTGAKILRRVVPGEGETIFWSGNRNGAEWREPGVLQDLFKNILFEFAGDDLDWLDTSVGSVAVGGQSSVDVTLSITGSVVCQVLSRHDGAVLMIGRQSGEPDVAVPVTMMVWPLAARFIASDGVVDWLDRPLPGNGSQQSALIQLLLTGPDGASDPPLTDGSVTDDDTMVLTLADHSPYSRFGRGYELEPDFGRFSELFSLAGVPAGAKAYVRAWDSLTFADSVAYGDSPMYTVGVSAYETKDFLSWIVNSVIDYPGTDPSVMRDYDGDSIPDGWMVTHRRIARDPILPLPTAWTREAELVVNPDNGLPLFDDPRKVGIYSNFVYVADSENNRIAICKLPLEEIPVYHGSKSSGDFTKPEGLAVDKKLGRLIVADTGHNRIVVFSINPATGALTYEFEVGGLGTLYGPAGVGVHPHDSRIAVADTENGRVRLFDPNGSPGTIIPGFDKPHDVEFDVNGLLFVADTENNRVSCYWPHGVLCWHMGGLGAGDGQFAGPRDIRFGVGQRMYVADTGNHRIQVFAAPGPITPPAFLGSYGPEVGEQRLDFPFGIAPLLTDNVLYVANTLEERVLKMRIVLDIDGDGMDDVWEDLNGLDPTDPDDWDDDPDGDLLMNIGEYRIRTNPHLADTDGNGADDGWEVAQGYDPSEAGMSVFMIRDLDISPGEVSWNAESGVVYQVQYTADLLSGLWTDGIVVTAETDEVLSWLHAIPPGEPQRFYRVLSVTE